MRGLLKNASEGIAQPKLILIFTTLLLGASLLPVVAFALAVDARQPIAIGITFVAIVISHLPRFLAARHFEQPIFGAIAHVPATVLFVAIQWIAFFMHATGRQVAWRGRVEVASPATH